MKKLLIVGDSLAGGLPHLSFPAVLAKMLPDWEIKARGKGGDTLAGISKRMEHLLPLYKPEVAILEAGANDVTLPLMKRRGGKWKRLAESIEKRGSVPADSLESFSDLYSRTIERIKEETSHIIVTTIACLGEDLNNRANGFRTRYNEVIREVAHERGVWLADTGKAFEKILKGTENPSGFFMDKFRFTFTDNLHVLTPRGSNRLSARRGLILTIDGAHLNVLGARTYAETIRESLLSNLEDNHLPYNK
jgi:lysophospholipase L1-like esterase